MTWCSSCSSRLTFCPARTSVYWSPSGRSRINAFQPVVANGSLIVLLLPSAVVLSVQHSLRDDDQRGAGIALRSTRSSSCSRPALENFSQVVVDCSFGVTLVGCGGDREEKRQVPLVLGVPLLLANMLRFVDTARTSMVARVILYTRDVIGTIAVCVFPRGRFH